MRGPDKQPLKRTRVVTHQKELMRAVFDMYPIASRSEFEIILGEDLARRLGQKIGVDSKDKLQNVICSIERKYRRIEEWKAQLEFQKLKKRDVKEVEKVPE